MVNIEPLTLPSNQDKLARKYLTLLFHSSLSSITFHPVDASLSIIRKLINICFSWVFSYLEWGTIRVSQMQALYSLLISNIIVVSMNWWMGYSHKVRCFKYGHQNTYLILPATYVYSFDKDELTDLYIIIDSIVVLKISFIFSGSLDFQMVYILFRAAQLLTSLIFK